MKRVIFSLTLIVLLLVGCEMLPQQGRFEDNPDRASITPTSTLTPTATVPPTAVIPTDTNPDRLTPSPTCVVDDCVGSTWTPTPDDYPTWTPNPDQLNLTALALTAQPTIDVEARLTHEALDQ